MKTFDYVITDPEGLHARPIMELAEMLAKSPAEAYLTRGKKTVSMARPLEMGGMRVRRGERVTVTVLGEQEDALYESLKRYFAEKL